MSINDLLDSEWVLIFVVAVLIVTPIIAVPKWISMKKTRMIIFTEKTITIVKL